MVVVDVVVLVDVVLLVLLVLLLVELLDVVDDVLLELEVVVLVEVVVVVPSHGPVCQLVPSQYVRHRKARPPLPAVHCGVVQSFTMARRPWSSLRQRPRVARVP